MSVYYPQGAMILRVLWEDFGNKKDVRLQEVYDLPILARRMTVNVNDYSQADTFDCEIDYKNFPFDPRCIRACAVTIFMRDMRKLTDVNNIPVQIDKTNSTVLFLGFADEESISFDDTKRTVKMEGRDLTALLIDRKYLGPPVDVSLPIDKIIIKLLAELKETTELKLDVRIHTAGALPILSTYSEEFSNMATKKNTARDDSYWDLIQGLVREAGLIAYVEIDKLVLSKPRVLYDNQQAKIFVYGKNLKNLEFKRKLGRRRNFNVVVRSLASVGKTKIPLKAEIPRQASAAWSKETGIANKDVFLPVINADGSEGKPKLAPALSFLVTANSQERLIEIGQEIYEELGRQQIEGSCETSDMETTHKAINFPKFEITCFNILKLRNGTPISIQIEQGDLKGVIDLKGATQKETVEKRTAFLIARCYEPKVAQVLAETIDKNSAVFYTKSVQFTLDVDNGFKAKIDFLNFIQVPKELAGG